MTLFGLVLEHHWWWLTLALILGIAEIVLPGVFLIWIGAAALVTGMLTLLFGLPVSAQFVVFAVGAIGAVWLGRRWLVRHPIETTDPLLNDRAARLLGKQVIVTQAIVGGEGKVKVGDSEWLASGPDCAAGTRVTVTGAEGARLKVATTESR